ncbi:hypothetical protein M422DRAFT_44582 [Sphaerobolus stellatus SS14]|nr:hypothetical protein M422DRAFT_44582 [Sphaerobolus stellatus SS14]
MYLYLLYSIAVWYSAFLAALLGLLAFAGNSATNALFALLVVRSNVAYTIPIAARFLYSRDTFVPGPFNLGRWSLPIATISIIFIAFINIIFFFPTSPNPSVAKMNYIVWFGTLFLSVVWYYFPVYGGVHWFNGPIRTVDNKEEDTNDGASSAADDEKKRKDSANEQIVQVK